MNKLHLTFPVVCFNQGIFRTFQNEDALVICNRLGLKNGWYQNLLLVDSLGQALTVKGARQISGAGWFWFLNQKIRVELDLPEESFQMSLNDVKKHVFDSFRKWHGWASGGNLPELRQRVGKAQSIPELIGILHQILHGPRERVKE